MVSLESRGPFHGCLLQLLQILELAQHEAIVVVEENRIHVQGWWILNAMMLATILSAQATIACALYWKWSMPTHPM